jgi:hypothetical protein
MTKRLRTADHVVVNYLRLPVRCGKAGCRCEGRDQSRWHGPYWYAFWNDPVTKRKRSSYLGKNFEPPVGPSRSRVLSERRPPPKPKSKE